MDPLVGRRLDRYEIRRVLGRGATGAVYAAYDPALEREVALKLLHRSDAKAHARFEREQQAATRLRHPNLAMVHAVGVVQEMPYIVLELVSGRTLDAMVEEVGVPAPRRAARITRAVASAIAYAHHEGILHRDLKPANILLDDDGEPRVVDFGLAALRDTDQSLTKTGALLGTPSYMSPEQAAGERAGPQSDVYGIGATLYHLLTGRPPFLDAPLLQVHRGTIEPPSALTPSVPAELDAICLRALARDPDERYTAAALADALEAFLERDPDEVPARGGAPIVAGLLVVIAGLIGVLVWAGRSDPDVAATATATPSPAPAASTEAPPTPAELGPQVTEALAAIDVRARGRARWPDLLPDLDAVARLAAPDPRLARRVALHRARIAIRRQQRTPVVDALAPLLADPGPELREAVFLTAAVHAQYTEREPAKAALAKATLDAGAWSYCLRALDASLDGDHATSRVHAKKALQLDPTNPHAVILYAMGALGTGQELDDAEQRLRALVQGPGRDYATAVVTQGGFFNRRGETEAVTALWRTVWSFCGPQHPERIVDGVALDALRNADPDWALRVLKHGATTGPAGVKHGVMRAFAYDQKLDPAAAQAAWRAAYRIDKADFERQMRRFKPQAVRFRALRAVGLPSRTVSLLARDRGLVKMLVGRVSTQATRVAFQALLEQAILGNPIRRLEPHLAALELAGVNDAQAHYWIARILAGRSALARAERAALKSFEIQARPESGLLIGLIRFRRRDHGAAGRILKTVSQRWPGTPADLLGKASALLARGRTHEAEVLCSRVLKQRKSHLHALTLRSQCLARQGRLAEGLKEIRKAVEVGRFLDLYPMTQLAQAEIDRALKGREVQGLQNAMALAEQVMAAGNSKRVRLSAAQAALLVNVRTPWGRGASDWLWEAEQLEEERHLDAMVALAYGTFLLKCANAGFAVERRQVERRWRRSAALGTPPNDELKGLFKQVFTDPYRPR